MNANALPQNESDIMKDLRFKMEPCDLCGWPRFRHKHLEHTFKKKKDTKSQKTRRFFI